jgi:Leucine-rich repeat (LRR) protein
MGQEQSTKSLGLRIERAVKLGVLTLNGLDLKEIPSRIEIVNSLLKELDISNNRLIHLLTLRSLKPSEYEKHAGKWTSLKGLACASNRIKDCSWICLIPTIERINLQDNLVTILPSSVCLLANTHSRSLHF